VQANDALDGIHLPPVSLTGRRNDELGTDRGHPPEAEAADGEKEALESHQQSNGDDEVGGARCSCHASQQYPIDEHAETGATTFAPGPVLAMEPLTK